jgi:hypothetical protein
LHLAVLFTRHSTSIRTDLALVFEILKIERKIKRDCHSHKKKYGRVRLIGSSETVQTPKNCTNHSLETINTNDMHAKMKEFQNALWLCCQITPKSAQSRQLHHLNNYFSTLPPAFLTQAAFTQFKKLRPLNFVPRLILSNEEVLIKMFLLHRI